MYKQESTHNFVALCLSVVAAAFVTGCASQSQVLEMEESVATSVVFSPDSSTIAFAYSDEIWVMDIKSRLRLSWIQAAGKNAKAPGRFSQHLGVRDSLLFLDNERIITTGLGAPVTIWNIQTGKRLSSIQLPDPGSFAISLAFSPDSDKLMIGTHKGQIYLAELDGNDVGELAKIGQMEGPVLDLAFGSEGRRLVAVDAVAPVVIWDLDYPGVKNSLLSSQYTTDVSVIPGSSKLLAVGTHAEEWDYTSPYKAVRFHQPSMVGQKFGMFGLAAVGAGAVAIATMPGGALAGVGGSMTAGEQIAGEALLSHLAASTDTVTMCQHVAAVSPDGQQVVIVTPGEFSNVVSVVDRARNKTVEELDSHERTCDLSFSPNGKYLAAATSESVYLYDTDSWDEDDLKGTYIVRRDVGTEIFIKAPKPRRN